MITIRDFYQRFELAGNIWKGMWECFEFINIGQPDICGSPMTTLHVTSYISRS